MRARFTVIYKIHGANAPAPEAESAQFFVSGALQLTATTTGNPEPHFAHIDRASALMMQLGKALFAPGMEGTVQERLAAEIEVLKASRAKKTESGVFIVFDGETDIPEPAFKARKDTDEFAITIDDIDKAPIRKTFRRPVQAALTALALSLKDNADRSVEKIGDVVYLIDPAGGKPVYAFNFQGFSARVSVSSPLTIDIIGAAKVLAPKLLSQDALQRPISLLLTSLDQATGELEGFIAAWAALEIFINATFKSTYEARWFEIMENGAPVSARPVFERLKDVMKDKYRLADKFLIIATVLDPDAATDDAKEFSRLKKLRDDLLHGLDLPAGPLPTEAVQKILLKYMKCHLA